MNEGVKRSDIRVQSRGQSNERWGDMTVRNFLIQPEGKDLW